MAENVFEGFEALGDMASMLSGKPGDNKSEDRIPEIDPEEIKGEEDNEEDDTESGEGPVGKTSKDNDEDREEPEDETGDEEENEEEDESTDGQEQENEEDGDAEDLSEYESDITSYLQKRLEEEIGIEFNEDVKFENVGELVKYLDTVVEEASKPRFANDELAKLNEFVSQGGKLEDYIKSGNTEVDLDNIDLESEKEQKAVVRELLESKGYSEDRIKKVINRYEDAGVLEEEAQDAVELLKDYKDKNRQKLLDQQQKTQKQREEQQQKFISDVEDIVKDMDSVRGVKISSGEKQELLDYIFKPGPDGMTQYQKDYASDVKNLIESAYFTKKGDALIERAKKSASSEASKQLHQRLKASKQKRQKGSGSGSRGQGTTGAGISALSKALLNS